MTEDIGTCPRAALARVVVVDDDYELREMILVPGLADFGFEVCGVDSAEALYRHILGNDCDLVVLDVGLPSEDGFSVARHLRSALGMRVGIVMLTGRVGDANCIRGLDDGADIYLTKPVDLEVLAATLHSLLRRMQAVQAPASGDSSQASAMSEWRLESEGWCLRSPQGKRVALTQAERSVMGALFSQSNKPVARDALIAALTDDAGAFDPHRLEMLVHRLRRKVEKRVGEELPIQAVRGTGYVMSVSG